MPVFFPICGFSAHLERAASRILARSHGILTDEQELGLPFISVSAPSIVSGMSGESEKTLRDTFDEAKVRAIFDSMRDSAFS